MTLPAAPIRPPGEEVEPPAIQPYGYGLLSVAQFPPTTGRRWELSGVVYPSDGCAPGGGVWLNPCEHPPPPGPITAFVVAVSQPVAGEYNNITVSLTSRDPVYAGAPVVVMVGGHQVVLETVGAPEVVDLGAPGSYTVLADVAATGPGPACGQTQQFIVVEAGTPTSPIELTCTVSPEWPVKRIPMGVGFTEGRAFIVYEAAGCLPVGFEDAANRAVRKLALHEQWYVEGQFQRDELLTTETEVLNGGTALPLAAAVALAEDAIADRYGGLGVLHIPREHYGSIPDRMLRDDGPRLSTKLRNLWAIGAGYSNVSPTSTPAPAGQVWIYVTGPVAARRSEVTTRESFSPARNERVALAERAYVLTADCLRLAVLAESPGAA